MANQIAVRVLTRPGDVVVAGPRPARGEFRDGRFGEELRGPVRSGRRHARVYLRTSDVRTIIDAEQDHQPHVAMVAIENTHMVSGGIPWELEDVRSLRRFAHGPWRSTSTARDCSTPWSATGTSAAEYSEPATMVMACLSKGLCAPVGSLLAGPGDLMAAALIERKRLGGTMRQAGFLAAAGTRGPRNDGRSARRGSRAAPGHSLRSSPWRFPSRVIDPTSCRTNIVAFDHPQARRIVSRSRREGRARWNRRAATGPLGHPRRGERRRRHLRRGQC